MNISIQPVPLGEGIFYQDGLITNLEKVLVPNFIPGHLNHKNTVVSLHHYFREFIHRFMVYYSYKRDNVEIQELMKLQSFIKVVNHNSIDFTVQLDLWYKGTRYTYELRV